MSIKVKLNKAIFEQALFEDGSIGATTTTPAANGVATSATPAAQVSLPEVSAGPATAALPAQPAKPVTPGSTPTETSQPGQSGTIANASTGAQPAANASTGDQLAPSEKVPEAKPQVDASNLAQANTQQLISGCLNGLIGLLNRQDAGGVYLKAIAESKSASDELKKAASDFSAIKPEDPNALIKGFVTFTNACSAELLKLAELKPAEGEATKTEEKPANQNAELPAENAAPAQ